MKKYLFLFLLPILFFPYSLPAQFSCDSSRYFLDVFDTVEVIRNIPYGNNGQDLFLDLYQPKGDSLAERPLLILAFGGSFVFGTKEDGYMAELGVTFAKKGYVVASIDYRLTPSIVNNPSNENFYSAVIKASHDMQASIRFFRKEAEMNNNPYRIDTNLIYSGGVSAGAITAIHAAYIQDSSEIPPGLDLTGIGGIEGLSGNPGYSSEVAGVINLCGAIGDSSWIDAGEAKMLSMHGDEDVIVPYGSGSVVVFNADLPVDGSASMKSRMEHEGIENPFYTWQGAGHTPFLTAFSNRPGDYMDTVISYSSGILYQWLCEHYSSTTPIAQILDKHLQIKVYPNPATDFIRVEWDNGQAMNFRADLSLYSLAGQKMEISVQETAQGYLIVRNEIPPGYYVIALADRNTRKTYYHNVLLR